jgi:hypothetical protein
VFNFVRDKSVTCEKAPVAESRGVAPRDLALRTVEEADITFTPDFEIIFSHLGAAYNHLRIR